MASITGGDNTAEAAYVSVLEPLLQELKDKKELFPKTVVYTKLKWCGFAYDFFNRSLLGESSVDISMVSQYHAPCKDDVSFDIVNVTYNIFIVLGRLNLYTHDIECCKLLLWYYAFM